MSRRTAVLVGNPRAGSRTLAAALHLHRALVDDEPSLVVDLAEVGPGLLDWNDERVAELVAGIAASDLVVVASPTYKATYTGLLKLVLDRFGVGELAGVAVPLMLGGGPGHTLAPEQGLVALLHHLGAIVPTGGIYVVERQHDDPAAYAPFVERTRPVVDRLLAAGVRATA
ncbi:NADPH-dependent FMN reductase [Nocardioides sp.]|uniref:NADPH-dependent FMN reductase n=1 Tax=Nocardioides sp. TaxID=35761 RepID=UPI0035155475